MNPHLRIFILLLMQVLSPYTRAQQYFFSNYTTENGLSNSSITCIVKDEEGYLWAGTYAGLNRFNGYDFTVYKSLAEDSSTLPSNVIHNLLTDHNGNLWIGTAHGICRYERKKNSFQRVYLYRRNGERVLNLESSTLFEDSKKNFWAATGSGLLKYNEQRECFEQILHDAPVHAKEGVTCITEDRDGSFWTLNYGFLVHFNKETHLYKEFENKIGNMKFQALKVHPDVTDPDYLWITTWGSGLVRFHKHSGEYVSYRFQQKASPNLDNIIFDLESRANHTLWLATNRGVFVFDVEKKIFSEMINDSFNEKPLINTQAHNIYTDDEGVIWIGSSGGLCNIHPAKQHFINHPLWLNPPVSTYVYDPAQDKFYGARIYNNRAVIIYDKRTNQVAEFKIPEADEIKAEPFALAKDRNGLLWIGTSKGIYTFNESQKKFSLFELENQLHISDRSLFVNQILSDRNGNLWFTCYSMGLMMVDPDTKKITTWFHSNSEPGTYPLFAIRGIIAGKGSTIVACDERNGLVILDYERKTWLHLDARLKKYSALVDATDIALDNSDRIWMTTKNNGLVCIDTNLNTTAYTKDDFGNIIDEQSSVALDDSGKVWLASSNGIYRFDPRVQSFSHFTIEDGFPQRTLTDALIRLADGKIAYQYYKGIYCFDPLKVSKTAKPLNTHVTAVFINGKSPEYNGIIDRLDTLVLNHTENNLTIEYAATNFNHAAATVYSYKLEGIDKNWSSPAQTRVVNYSQLSPGNYRLRIKASENSPEKQLFIQIIPAWWQTVWFRWAAVFLSIAGIVWIVRLFLSIRYRQKIAQLERQQEIESIRSRISRDIHDEIGSGLTKIKLMSRTLSKKSAGDLNEDGLSQKISSASDELIQNLGEIVWTINPANDSLENVIAYIRNYLSKLFEENPEVRLQLDLPEPSNVPEGNAINPEMKRNLILILKEALTNIFKHARATEVAVSLHMEDSKIRLRIRDNGIGITATSQNGFGNGINNMRRRAETIHAQFDFVSGPDRGTKIELLIPMEGS